MSNGNDWQQGGGNRQPGYGDTSGPPQQPPSGGAGGAGSPPPSGGGGNDVQALITEGWGGGKKIEFDEVIARLKLVAKTMLGPVLIAWFGVAALMLVFDMLTGVLNIADYFIKNLAVSSALRLIEKIVGVAEYPLYYIVFAMQVAMFKPMHTAIFQGKEALGGPVDVLKSAAGVFLYTLATLLLIALAFSIGGLCCVVPGIALSFVFCQAPYFVATQGLDPIEAIKRSFEVNKTYWQVILAAVVGIAVFGAAGGCVRGIFGWIIGLASSFLYPFNYLFIDFFTWLGIEIAFLGIFVVQMTIFSLIESKERGVEAA